jgi:hypothetical protein
VKSKTAEQHQVGRSGIMLTLDNVSSVIEIRACRSDRGFLSLHLHIALKHSYRVMILLVSSRVVYGVNLKSSMFYG